MIKYLKSDNTLQDQLLNFLKEGNYQVGERIPSERDLSKKLGASRNLLRETIKVLKVMGILEIRPGSGTYLQKDVSLYGANVSMWISFHKDEVLNLHVIREALDIKAIELIPPKRLAKVGDDLQKCVDKVDIDTCSADFFCLHDAEFHNIIRKASKNHILYSITNDITGTIYDERKTIFADPERIKSSYAQHATIAKAFKTYNVEFIREVCLAHYRSVYRYIAEDLD